MVSIDYGSLKNRLTSIEINGSEAFLVTKQVFTLFSGLKARDEPTAAHSVIMAKYMHKLARIFDPLNVNLYYLGGLIHDIGKLSMSDDILKSSSIISSKQKLHLQQHVLDGVKLLTEVGMPALIIEIAQNHHERFNGTGYPKGLYGSEIPMSGRIAAITDTFSALTVYRRYQPVKDSLEAIEIMKDNSFLYDPDIMKCFINLIYAEQAMTE
ncbi:hypothetical protein YDYSY3_39440 [Paenibacillus chitinolyticus]|uniref:HD-GYP domain-containing protein n=1 Tax=Paenibacillus chitinolyticus TaxID=79263 RepID=UPI0026E4CBEF|nr:HD domain-containing phosphohydrolase [Paenibacillus chitinolyticus]GKS12944.1 hypothetical protein YDYSY3_39440 [Paenibacillus chitinolyticus]